MLLNQNVADDTVTMGFGKTTDYQMAANIKAFMVMSDSLYENKIGSCVREISCNAADSHVMAGKADVPFYIHVPTAMEPWFSVRDIGLGMSDEAVRTNFCTLFLSTKDNSNEAVGAFGLGSKTPFAYTDSFVIVSNYNGICTEYQASIGGNKLPTIAEIDSNETSEPNGVEIRFAVSNKDCDRFRDEVRNQLKFFKVKPIIEGGKVEWEVRPDPFKVFGKLELLPKAAGYRSHTTYVVQGGVGYPLKLEYVSEALTPAEYEWAQTVCNQGATLNFEIGEIEVTPSREGISYKFLTITNIAKLFKDAYAEFESSVMADVSALPNDWARAKYIVENDTLVASMFRKDNRGYNFMVTGSTVNFSLKDMNDERDQSVTDANGVTTTETVSYQKYFITTYNESRRGISKGEMRSHSLIPYNSGYRFFYNDKPTYVPSRIRQYLQRHNVNNLFLFNKMDGTAMDAADVARMSAMLGGVEIKPVSSLECPASNRQGNGGGYKIPTAWRILDASQTDKDNQEATFESIKEIGGGYYVAMGRTEIYLNYHMRAAYIYMFQNGLFDMEVYALRPSTIEKLKDNPKWISVYTAVETWVNAKVGSYTKFTAIRMAYYNAMRSALSYNLSLINALKVCTFTNRSKELNDILKIGVGNKYSEIDNFINDKVIAKYGGEYRDAYNKFEKQFKQRIRDFCNKYPLASRSNIDVIDHIAIYINAVNGMKTVDITDNVE